MRSPQAHLSEAQQRLGVANHLLTRTYPMVQDSRILLAVAKDLHAAVTLAVSALLEHDHQAKRIPALVRDPESRLELLEESLQHHKLDPTFHKTVREFHDIVVTHEKSPVEFAKPDRFIICDKDYRITAVTAENLKQSLGTCRTFIDTVTKIVSEDHAGVAV